jgi:glucokinase
MGMVIGVDLGGTKMAAAAVAEDGQILASAREKTRPEEGVEAVIARLADLSWRVTRAAGAGAVPAVCVGVPGGVDDATGVVDKASNLGWEGVALGPALSALLGGARVFLDNDVRVAVLGEHTYGLGKGTRTMVGVFVGTGIGGGVVAGGQLHLGGRGAAGELGHMVLKPKGPRCSCGRRGCVEALASRTAMERRVWALIARGHKSILPRLLKKEGRTRLTSSVIAQALDAEDPVMTEVVARAQRYLALMVGSVVNLLDPEVVVVGGGLAERLGDRFVAPIREGARARFLVERAADRVLIAATALKETAAPLGAAEVARARLGKGDASGRPRLAG